MSGLHIVGSMLAGLGLFFVGIHMLSGNLRQMTSRRFRMLLAGWTRSPWVSALIGVLHKLPARALPVHDEQRGAHGPGVAHEQAHERRDPARPCPALGCRSGKQELDGFGARKQGQSPSRAKATRALQGSA